MAGWLALALLVLGLTACEKTTAAPSSKPRAATSAALIAAEPPVAARRDDLGFVCDYDPVPTLFIHQDMVLLDFSRLESERALGEQLRRIRDLAEQLGGPPKTQLLVYVEKGVRPAQVRTWLAAARGAGMTDISLFEDVPAAPRSAPKGRAGSSRTHSAG